MTEKTTEKNRQEEFLRELTALSKKYEVGIFGCGCCGSPFLGDVEVDGRRYSVDTRGEYMSLRSEEDIAELDWWKKD